MKTFQLERGDKELNIDIYDNGDIEITIYCEHYGWNDGNKSIDADIILTKDQAAYMLEFLIEFLERAA